MKLVQKKSLVLGIDTSCDETSVAVLLDEKKILANIISSQVKIHAPHGGVVPELASRSHLEALTPVLEEALQKAGVGLSDLTGIAVTSSPGLIGCLLVGLSFAKSLAYSLKIPLTTVHHLKAHLFSPFLEQDLEQNKVFPFLGLVVSGGHTALYYVSSFDQIELLGQTVDDAAGEAYDKVAKLLEMGYPGGPLIDRLAKTGNANAHKFTRARVKRGPYYFSFSGLKTAVSLLVKEEKKKGILSEEFKKDMAASFQKEVVEALIEKIEDVLKSHPAKALLVSGGVAANSLLRSRVAEVAANHHIPHTIPSLLICTDNGAMVAYIGAKQLERGEVAELNVNAASSLPMV